MKSKIHNLSRSDRYQDTFGKCVHLKNYLMSKQKFIVLALSGLMGTAILTGCSTSSEQKVENAAENVNAAQKNLDEAERKYSEEWEKFRVENEQRINTNESEIATYREREKTDKAFKIKYKEAVDNLEAKNEQMKARMRDGKEKAKDRWEEFKREWNHDMDELGTAIKDLVRNNEN